MDTISIPSTFSCNIGTQVSFSVSKTPLHSEQASVWMQKACAFAMRANCAPEHSRPDDEGERHYLRLFLTFYTTNLWLICTSLQFTPFMSLEHALDETVAGRSAVFELCPSSKVFFIRHRHKMWPWVAHGSAARSYCAGAATPVRARARPPTPPKMSRLFGRAA
jgi:hypothetical protein